MGQTCLAIDNVCSGRIDPPLALRRRLMASEAAIKPSDSFRSMPTGQRGYPPSPFRIRPGGRRNDTKGCLRHGRDDLVPVLAHRAVESAANAWTHARGSGRNVDGREHGQLTGISGQPPRQPNPCLTTWRGSAGAAPWSRIPLTSASSGCFVSRAK